MMLKLEVQVILKFQSDSVFESPHEFFFVLDLVGQFPQFHVLF